MKRVAHQPILKLATFVASFSWQNKKQRAEKESSEEDEVLQGDKQEASSHEDRLMQLEVQVGEATSGKKS